MHYKLDALQPVCITTCMHYKMIASVKTTPGTRSAASPREQSMKPTKTFILQINMRPIGLIHNPSV
jgi:hypothetical protein